MQGPLHAVQGTLPSFAQTYFYDPEYASDTRAENHPELRRDLLRKLSDMLHAVNNPFISIYRTAKETLEADEGNDNSLRVILNPQMQIVVETGSDKRRTNLPTSNEVAIFVPDEYNKPGFHDIVFAEKSEENNRPRFWRIEKSHTAYMPLHYVLLFLTGKPGWGWTLQLQSVNGVRASSQYSMRRWY